MIMSNYRPVDVVSMQSNLLPLVTTLLFNWVKGLCVPNFRFVLKYAARKHGSRKKIVKNLR